MSNNAIFLRSNKLRNIGGRTIVLFYHGYDYEVSALRREKLYGSEARYERIVNQREDKAMALGEKHGVVDGAVLANNWTDIDTMGGTPVYEVTGYDYRLTENPAKKVVGFVRRDGYQYCYIPFKEAPESWKQEYPRPEEGYVQSKPCTSGTVRSLA